MSNGGSKASEIRDFSFLVAFANDGTLDQWEIEFMKRLALEDGVIDEAEKRVFRQIFSRLSKDKLSPDAWSELERFKKRFGI